MVQYSLVLWLGLDGTLSKWRGRWLLHGKTGEPCSVLSCPEVELVQSGIRHFRLPYCWTISYLFLGTSGGRKNVIPQPSLVLCLMTFLFRVSKKFARSREEIRVGKMRKTNKHVVLSYSSHIFFVSVTWLLGKQRVCWWPRPSTKSN